MKAAAYSAKSAVVSKRPVVQRKQARFAANKPQQLDVQQSVRNWDLAAPMVQSDGMPDAPEFVQSMATGKWYDSKSKLRQEYRDLGKVEVGNDPSIVDPKPFKKPRSRREDLRPHLEKAISQVNLTSSRKDEIPT